MTRRLLVHAGANAAILILIYYWLGLAESRALSLVWSAVVAMIIVGLTCWTYGAAFASVEEHPGRLALRNLLPFTLAVAIVFAVYLLLQRPGVVFRVLQWILIPVILLPLLSAIARRGWRGFSGAGIRPAFYYLQAPFLLLLGLWVPFQLITWTPRPGSFGMQVVSLILRFSVAYLLFVAALLLLAFITSGGKPRFSHARTAGSP